MVLGNPHFPWRGRYRFTQSHLTIPGVYDVAGAMLHGSPAVNIGGTRTSPGRTPSRPATGSRRTSTARCPARPTTYLTESGPKQLERREVSVPVRNADGSVGAIAGDLYRTDEGYVLDAPAVLLSWTPVSFFALRDANGEHLRTLDSFHEMAKTRTVQELKAAQDRTGGIPWVNTMAADRDGNALYADSAVVPNVPNDLVQECATPVGRVLFQLAGLPALDGTRAKSSCAWRSDADAPRPGIMGPGNQPSTVRRDWVINANDSHWLPNPEQPLEGFDRIIGCERCERSLRTRMVYRYVLDRLDGSDGYGGPDLFTLDQLKATQHENRVFGAELSREGDDLQDVCRAADGGAACDVLAAWDGRTNTTSVGAHVFREFWQRTAAANRFEVPFSAADPVGTPRDFDESDDANVQAMRRALAFLREKGVPFDAPLGSLQVAADDGAPRIAIGGGLGQTGNANVVDAGNPAANVDALYPISRGSSHIQAVSFTDSGVDASTILTYGMSTNETSGSSSDQTQLFSQERWVDFPFTAAEVAAGAVRRYEVVGPAAAAPAPAAAAPVAAAPADAARADRRRSQPRRAAGRCRPPAGSPWPHWRSCCWPALRSWCVAARRSGGGSAGSAAPSADGEGDRGRASGPGQHAAPGRRAGAGLARRASGRGHDVVLVLTLVLGSDGDGDAAGRSRRGELGVDRVRVVQLGDGVAREGEVGTSVGGPVLQRDEVRLPHLEAVAGEPAVVRRRHLQHPRGGRPAQHAGDLDRDRGRPAAARGRRARHRADHDGVPPVEEALTVSGAVGAVRDRLRRGRGFVRAREGCGARGRQQEHGGGAHQHCGGARAGGRHARRTPPPPARFPLALRGSLLPPGRRLHRRCAGLGLPRLGRADPDGLAQQHQLVDQVLRHRVDVGHQLAVGDQAEVHAARQAHDGDVQALPSAIADSG
jgi:hypothetical protein